MLVVDASVIAPAVADADADGAAFRHRLRGETIAAPGVLRVEAVSILRRKVAVPDHSRAGVSRIGRPA